MNNENELLARNTIRQRTVALLENLAQTAAAFELPKPPEFLGRSRDKLAENSYLLLVTGEAKRGKSTFVNALLGRKLLPTDVDIATCQVFHISHAPQEEYHLCFEDGSTQAITAADLPRYGSQGVVDTQGQPAVGGMMRWIDVKLPARFLPVGLSLLDTPGLGSLYAAHAQITQRFVPQADAVIFVLDSERPITAPEIQFLNTILKGTTWLFFVQTKIDAYREAHWLTIQQRNEEVLQQRFGDRLPNIRVWPLSSADVLRSVQSGDEDYLVVSGQPELSAALQEFLFRAAGWGRTVEALAAADQYYTSGRLLLEGRLTTLHEESAQKRIAAEQTIRQRVEQFHADWQGGGLKRQELLAQVERVAAGGLATLQRALQPGGEIEAVQRQRIEAVGSHEEAEQLGAALAGEVIAAAGELWRQVTEQSAHACAELLQPLEDAGNALGLLAGLEQGNVDKLLSAPAIQGGWWAKTRAVQSQQGMATLLTQVVVTIYPKAKPYLTNGLLWNLLGSFVWNPKRQLQEHLGGVMGNVRGYFFAPDPVTGQPGVVEQYGAALIQTMTQRIDLIAAQKLAEAQLEGKRLQEALALDEQARKAWAEQVATQLEAWTVLQDVLGELVWEAQALERNAGAAAQVVGG